MKKKSEINPPSGGQKPEAGADHATPLPLLPEDWREFVEEMLVAGLAVEDIVEAVIQKGGQPIQPGAILAHYRTHVELQTRRVVKSMDNVAKLREALGNPQADHALVELANSALLAGYLGLSNKSAASLSIKDAEVIRLSRENLKLKKRYLQLKEVGQKRENRLLDSRLRHEDDQHNKACFELKKLGHSLRNLVEEGKLDSSTIEKIKEIYGIVRQPFIPDITEKPSQG